MPAYVQQYNTSWFLSSFVYYICTHMYIKNIYYVIIFLLLGLLVSMPLSLLSRYILLNCSYFLMSFYCLPFCMYKYVDIFLYKIKNQKCRSAMNHYPFHVKNVYQKKSCTLIYISVIRHQMLEVGVKRMVLCTL